jgi:hypothetical protein
MAKKKSGTATPGGGTAGGGSAAAGDPAAKAAKQTPAGAKPSPPSQKAPAAFAALVPGTPGGTTDDTANGDGPCFEFQQVLDENGNPVLRKVQVPCPEK